MKLPLLMALIVAAGAVGAWVLTGGDRIAADDLAVTDGDPAAGEQVFHAAGCASCHSAPDATGDAQLVLAGGQVFPSPFGTFRAPNISPHPDAGIGDWTLADMATALRHGVGPRGQHYYPAFPYTAYTHMTDRDIADLWAFMQTLPVSDVPSAAHDLSFPFSIRRTLAVWKWMNLDRDYRLDTGGDPVLDRGRYLVEALGHCAECHTPRDMFGGLRLDAWMAGAANPTGDGRIPNITPAALDWSAADIAYYLESGFTPDWDSAGGHMTAVIANMARLPATDREAIAAYLKALPPVPSGG
jgi:mono/diheme cytochrome c family protein